MNILVTNDDGIQARGLRELILALGEYEDVYVCAPDSQRSACGHGITMTMPVVITEDAVPGAKMAWRTSGTPADCVKVGIHKLSELGISVDLVVSGINHGANLGSDVFYSGTVSGAMEGLLMGVPAMAVSLDDHRPAEGAFKPCTDAAVKVLLTSKGRLKKDTLININVPSVPAGEIKGIRMTKLGPREYDEWFEVRTNPNGQSYYWYSGKPVIYEDLPEDLDVVANQNGYITITPLHSDLTDQSMIAELESWNIQ